MPPWRGSRANWDFGDADGHFIGHGGIAANKFPPADRASGWTGPFFGKTVIDMAKDRMANVWRFHSRTVPRR